MKKLFFIILVIALSGCASRKTIVKEDVSLDTVEKVEKEEKETVRESSSTEVAKESKTNVTDKSVTRTTETEYSEPDGEGNQHKKRETTTETFNDISTLNEENERIISEQKNEIERLTVDNSTLRTQLEASHQEETKTSTRPPIWPLVVSFITGIISLLLLRSWLKGIFKR